MLLPCCNATPSTLLWHLCLHIFAYFSVFYHASLQDLPALSYHTRLLIFVQELLMCYAICASHVMTMLRMLCHLCQTIFAYLTCVPLRFPERLSRTKQSNTIQTQMLPICCYHAAMQRPLRCYGIYVSIFLLTFLCFTTLPCKIYSHFHTLLVYLSSFKSC